MTKFDDAHYHWERDPTDGEYEFQFDHFESTADYHDQVILLIADKESDDLIGQVNLQTEDVPDLDPNDPATTKIFHGTVEDSKVVDLAYDQELSEQRHEKMKELHDRVRASSDDERDTDG